MATQKKSSPSKKTKKSAKEKETSKSPVAQGRKAWNPFMDMDDMFKHMMARPFSRDWISPLRMDWPFHDFEHTPRVDVVDRDHEVLIRAEVPGVERDDLEIILTGTTVTFRGHAQSETEEDEGTYHHREMRRGEFSRTVSLPANVDDSAAKAKYKDGIVELTLPKLEATKRRRIEIATD